MGCEWLGLAQGTTIVAQVQPAIDGVVTISYRLS